MPMPKVKHLALATGLYRPARWMARRLRPAEMRAHLADIRLYRSLLPDGALCFDVGANIGVKSEALLKAGARVVSFEPHPLLLPELKARCGRHSHWTIVPTALGSSAAVGTLYAHQWHGESSLDREWKGNVVATYHVPIITLDAAIQRFGRPSYCKIDVEGWELEVLKGLTQPVPLLSVEFHLTDRDVARARSCLQRLSEFGSSHVNLSPAESSSLYLPEWMPLDEFLAWFPGDLRRTLPGDLYGDIFVRNATLNQEPRI